MNCQIMRNTTNIYTSNGLNGMNINPINAETNTTIAPLNIANRPNECHQMGLPMASKSQPKQKTKCIDSSSRPTKRPPSERRFKCDQCERMFFTRKDVKRHLVVHTGIRNFACPYCTQRFGRKDHLVRHAKKSHNRDTRSSTVKTNSIGQTSNKVSSNGVPTLVQSKNNGISSAPVVPLMGQQLAHNHNKQTYNYQTNGQNGDHSALVLLTNSNINAINNSHNESNADNQSSNYLNHSNPNPNHTNHLMIAGMHTNESLCQYMSGVHTFDDMIASNAIKSETPPLTPHYFAFPVNSGGLTYSLPSPPFLPNCLVANSNSGLSSCASSASVAAFGIPVSNVSNSSAPIHTPFSADVNPSLPHFNQAFQ